MLKIDGVDYKDDEEVEVYKGADGYFHVVESLEKLKEKEYETYEKAQ